MRSRKFSPARWSTAAACVALVALGMAWPGGPAAASRTAPRAVSRQTNPFCQGLAAGRYQASQGARMYCFGPQPTTGGQAAATEGRAGAATPANVAASDLAEDVAPNGTRGYGQSEESVAVNGSYAVEAWNDATAFFSPCGAADFKEEGTGYAFSSNGGRTFRDLGGLVNFSCATTGFIYEGDPSVATITVNGVAYFYISSLYDSLFGGGASKVALSACTASGSGSAASLTCSQPITIAQSSQCQFGFCSFLDKDFLAIDPLRHRLYATYTEFLNAGSAIELGFCSLVHPAAPACQNGIGPAQSPPFLVVAAPNADGCENEGAYPAVDVRTGDVYVAYEHNWASNLGNVGPCASDPVSEVVNRIPFSALTLPRASGGVTNTRAILITSMGGAAVPGYNRFPGNDFPRIAVSDPYGVVTIVWNDARYHPLGDILMKSWTLGDLVSASGLVRLNADTGGLHFLPALRTADSQGLLDVSWYQRASGTTTLTNVMEVSGVNPRTVVSPTANTLITNVASDWNGVSSDIVPNFGDYTDNALVTTSTEPFVGQTLAIAWADGRSGAPQAYFAKH